MALGARANGAGCEEPSKGQGAHYTESFGNCQAPCDNRASTIHDEGLSGPVYRPAVEFTGVSP